jgi:hypothetical protein
MALNFQTIGQRNGRSSQFGGVIESMRAPGGETVRVDNEGKVEPTDSQTEKTVQRGTIGAALGAIIGAIAGGGKGLPSGGDRRRWGAGTVIAQGRDQLDLQRGTEVTITRRRGSDATIGSALRRPHTQATDAAAGGVGGLIYDVMTRGSNRREPVAGPVTTASGRAPAIHLALAEGLAGEVAGEDRSHRVRHPPHRG